MICGKETMGFIGFSWVFTSSGLGDFAAACVAGVMSLEEGSKPRSVEASHGFEKGYAGIYLT